MAVPPSTLRPNATNKQYNTFLSQLSIPGWKVHPKLVEFNNPPDRERKATLLTNKYKKDMTAEQWDEWKETVAILVEDLKLGDIVNNGVLSMRQSGSIVMVCGDWEKDLAQELKPDENRQHVVLAFLKDRQVSNSNLKKRK